MKKTILKALLGASSAAIVALMLQAAPALAHDAHRHDGYGRAGHSIHGHSIHGHSIRGHSIHGHGRHQRHERYREHRSDNRLPIARRHGHRIPAHRFNRRGEFVHRHSGYGRHIHLAPRSRDWREAHEYRDRHRDHRRIERRERALRIFSGALRGFGERR